MRFRIRSAVPCALILSASLARADDIGTQTGALAMLTPHMRGTLAGVPTDRELEARGARIGRIQIMVDDVFEESSLSAPYRMVNSLHISTHSATVDQQLLFREGDAFERRVLDETERLLREQRYLSDASVETLRYNDDNTVDVLVRVHDVWTMSPGISFGRKGGENSAKVEFEDTNFLGLGKTVSLGRSQNVDRSAWRLGYVDPHVFGSWWRLSAAHSTLSDGSDDQLALGRLFYSLDSRWSAGMSAVNTDATVPRYSLGKEIERFGAQVRTFGIDGGISRGLVDGLTTRYLFGVRYDEHDFAADSSAPNAFIPDDRRYAYPYVGMQWIEDSYITTRNLNQIGRTEDLHLGRSLTVTAGWASSALGSTNSALILTTIGEAGLDFGNEQYLIGNVGLSSRVEGGGLRNAQFDVGGRYYKRQSEHRVFFAGLDATASEHLDEDSQLLLGGDNGLRGYPLRYQAGHFSRGAHAGGTVLYELAAVQARKRWRCDIRRQRPDVGSRPVRRSARRLVDRRRCRSTTWERPFRSGQHLACRRRLSPQSNQRHRQHAADDRNEALFLMQSTLALTWWRLMRWPTLAFAILAPLFAGTDLDVAIATEFYDTAHAQWIGAHNWWIGGFIHTGGRWMIRAIVVGGLALWLASQFDSGLRVLRRPSAYFVIAMVLGIGIVGLLKTVTNVDCPWDLLPFGGRFPVVHLFADRPDVLRTGRCFPAAHASSGYALVALYFVFRERNRVLARVGWRIGLVVGLVFGLSQQARGAHFMSHDLWSAYLVWFTVASVYVFGFQTRLSSSSFGVADGTLDLVRDRLDVVRRSDGSRSEAGARGDLGGAWTRCADERLVRDRLGDRSTARAALGASVADGG